MSSIEEKEYQFVVELTKRWNDPGFMADLRRGARVDNPKADARHARAMSRLLYGIDDRSDDRFYLVASLFAVVHTGTNEPRVPDEMDIRRRPTIGASFRALRDLEARERGLGPDDTSSVDHRFRKLLDSDPGDLPNGLRHAVRLLSSRHGTERGRVAIDWVRLIHDLRPWNIRNPNRWIQEKWAQD